MSWLQTSPEIIWASLDFSGEGKTLFAVCAVSAGRVKLSPETPEQGEKSTSPTYQSGSARGGVVVFVVWLHSRMRVWGCVHIHCLNHFRDKWRQPQLSLFNLLWALKETHSHKCSTQEPYVEIYSMCWMNASKIQRINSLTHITCNFIRYQSLSITLVQLSLFASKTVFIFYTKCVLL